MALIASVSGIRGTIGGESGANLTPEDIVRFTAAYATWLIGRDLPRRVVLGRDGRISGPVVQGLVLHTLQAMGLDVVDLGLTTTPTLEMAVPAEDAGGGIILTASHNPAEWNALKLLNEQGEFLSAADGETILSLVRDYRFQYAPADQLGRHFLAGSYLEYHIGQILALPLIDVEAVRNRRFRVVVDAINSTGAMAMPLLLEALGATCIVINPEVTGRFAHNPEPLPEHLGGLGEAVLREGADLGVAVDPDVDRLALVSEDGSWFGEEYTLVAAADLVLAARPGPVVHNLSSSRALRDLAARCGQTCHAAAVGEVHVVRMMRDTGAVIGGEGNGGVILPDLHYGRDALLGLALVLTLLAQRNTTLSALRKTYPDYAMAKHKAALTGPDDWDAIRQALRQRYASCPIDETDGLKVDLPQGWLHLRKSNTEPILRIYTEMPDAKAAEALATEVAEIIRSTVQA
jgi:phosphomannomutase